MSEKTKTDIENNSLAVCILGVSASIFVLFSGCSMTEKRPVTSGTSQSIDMYPKSELPIAPSASGCLPPDCTIEPAEGYMWRELDCSCEREKPGSEYEHTLPALTCRGKWEIVEK